MAKTKVVTKTVKSAWTLERVLPWLLVIVGVIGTACAFIIMYEKLHLLANPSYQTACDINPIISCGSVMQSDQAEAFGFPNPFLGLIGFPIVATIGVAMLAGATFKRWFWRAAQAGMLFSLLFVHWLFYQAVYNIGALCPWCMVVWTVTILGFWYLLLYNLRMKHIPTPKSLTRVVAFAQRHHVDILVGWYLIIFVLIMHHFWYYFGRNL